MARKDVVERAVIGAVMVAATKRRVTTARVAHKLSLVSVSATGAWASVSAAVSGTATEVRRFR